ncbi:MAG TPA: hypothetical protein PLO14_02105 [Accumulibacter sp.]|nr:hypothetical protein [Accumulibacter sp.]
MKTLSVTLAVACLMIAAQAKAVTCEEGVRHAACETSRGAVEVRKPVPVAEVPHKEVVVEPTREVVEKPKVEVVPECRIVDGRRVCR